MHLGAHAHVSADPASAIPAKGLSSGFKTFTSKSSSIVYHATSVTKSTPKPVTAKPRTNTAGTTLYVEYTEADVEQCVTGGVDPGTGTSANPYCRIQDAVSAAEPGDTISVQGDADPFLGSVTVTTSDLTIVGSNGPIESWANTDTPVPDFVLDGVSGVTISNLTMDSSESSAVEIIDSSDVTLNSDYAIPFDGSAAGGITIDGDSKDITVSRTSVAQESSVDGVGISVAPGAADVVLASDILGGFPGGAIEASGVDGLDIVGNTVQRSCGAAISISGSSTGVSVENNLFEDPDPTIPLGAAAPSQCVAAGLAWAPDITVAADSVDSTSSDYNAFYSYGSNDTDPYGWGGVVYATVTAFQTATTQGAHDLNDPVEAVPMLTDPFGWNSVNAMPQSGSAALEPGNASAPGALDSDFNGSTPYVNRGAIAVGSGLVASMSVTDTSVLSVSADASGSSGANGIETYSFAWGDGDTTTSSADTATHTYATAGTYTVTLTITDMFGISTSASVVVETAPNDDMVARQTVTDISALGISDDASASTGEDGVATYDFVWGDGSTTNFSSSTGTHTYAKPGTYTVTLTVVDKNFDSAETSVRVTTAGSDYTAYGPIRLLDTRNGTGVAKASQVPAHGTVKLKIVGNGSIPAGVTAVVLNVTVTNAHGSGFVTVYGDGAPGGVPTTSNVNYVAGQTVPNLVVVPVGTDGDVDLFNGGQKAGAIDLIADISGYFSPSSTASGYTSLTPDRLVDTRFGTGAPEKQVAAGGTLTITIGGSDGGQLPSTGITAVALNVTVTNPKGNGFLTLYPEGESVPNASNVNYVTGQTIANSVIVPVSSNGEIQVTNGGTEAKGTDIIVDVTGYYSTNGASAYVPLPSPVRLIDTRNGTGIIAGQLLNGNYIYAPLGIDSQSDVNSPDITGFVLNTTVTNTKGNGFLTVSPDPNTYQEYQNHTASPVTPPNSSNLNWTKGETVPNLVQASSGANGVVDFWNLGGGGGGIDLIVDAFGYYQND